MGVFLVMFIVSIILTTIGDDTVGATRVDINGLVDQIKDGNVTEINQRNGIQMIIFLKNKERLVYFRPANSVMTTLLQDAGITSDQMTGINFTSGEPSNIYTTIGGLIRHCGGYHFRCFSSRSCASSPNGVCAASRAWPENETASDQPENRNGTSDRNGARASGPL